MRKNLFKWSFKKLLQKTRDTKKNIHSRKLTDQLNFAFLVIFFLFFCLPFASGKQCLIILTWSLSWSRSRSRLPGGRAGHCTGWNTPSCCETMWIVETQSQRYNFWYRDSGSPNPTFPIKFPYKLLHIYRLPWYILHASSSSTPVKLLWLRPLKPRSNKNKISGGIKQNIQI